MPKVALDWRIAGDDFAHVQRSIELFTKDVTSLGLGTVQVRPPSEWATRGTYHHMGTTRMSTDPRRGVVDDNSRVHGVRNLYVAGSSGFPTAGSGTPTLMLIALSLRLADHVATRVSADPRGQPLPASAAATRTAAP